MRAGKKGDDDEDKKLQTRGKGSRWLFPRDERGYSCCGAHGLSRGEVRLSVAALVVEIRRLGGAR